LQANDAILLSLIRATLETMVTENGREDKGERQRYPLLDKPGLAYLHNRLLEEVMHLCKRETKCLMVVTK
jgi:hypothetical protein